MEAQLSVDLLDSSVEAAASVDVEPQMACDDLRDAVYDQGKGTWYDAVFSVTPGAGLGAEYDQDAPPFEGGGSPDLFEDNQRAYPRDAAHIPAWHALAESSDG
jgi:hypothetical protein